MGDPVDVVGGQAEHHRDAAREPHDLVGVLARVVVALLDRGGQRLHARRGSPPGTAAAPARARPPGWRPRRGPCRCAWPASARGRPARAARWRRGRRARRRRRSSTCRRSRRGSARRRARSSPRRSREAAGRTRRRRSGRPGRTGAARCCSARATRRSSSSPAAWPRVSLTPLKSSRSRITAPSGALVAAGAGDLLADADLHRAVVEDAGQRVGAGDVLDVLVGLGVAAGDGRQAGDRLDRVPVLVVHAAAVAPADGEHAAQLVAPRHRHGDRGLEAVDDRHVQVAIVVRVVVADDRRAGLRARCPATPSPAAMRGRASPRARRSRRSRRRPPRRCRGRRR